MKKIVLLSGLLAFAVQADDGSASEKNAVEGFYAGLGICWNHSINKIKATDAVDNNGAVDWFGDDILHKKSDKIGGSLVAGYGEFITGNFYLGGEITLDIAGNKTSDVTYELKAIGTNECHTKVKGFIPSVALRLGGWCCPIDSLVYVRLGLAWVKAEYQEKDTDYVNDVRKLNKVSPVIGLGIEKNVYGNINVRAECDYRFQVKKEDKTSMKDNSYSYNVENRLKGFTVRLMATYKF